MRIRLQAEPFGNAAGHEAGGHGMWGQFLNWTVLVGGFTESSRSASGCQLLNTKCFFSYFVVKKQDCCMSVHSLVWLFQKFKATFLPFQNVISTFLLLSCLSMEEKTTLIQKPLWEASLLPGAHGVSLCSLWEVQRVSGTAMVTQQFKEVAPHWHLDSQFWTRTAFSAWHSGIIEDGAISLPDIIWFCSREQAAYMGLIKPD